MRYRVALVIAVSLLFGALVAQPATSAVVVKAVACGTCGTGFKWSPTSTSVVHGTKVTWKAMTGTHTVTAISKNWSKNVTLSAGDSTSFTFKSAGTYRFRCKFHSSYNPTTKKCTGMCGKILVS